MDRQGNESPPTLWQLVPQYVACYVLWLAFGGLTLWTLLEFRDAVLGFLPLVGNYIMSGLDKASFVLFGVLALAWIMFVEGYLREGVGANVFWRRVQRIAVVQAALLAVAFGVQALALLWT